MIEGSEEKSAANKSGSTIRPVKPLLSSCASPFPSLQLLFSVFSDSEVYKICLEMAQSTDLFDASYLVCIKNVIGLSEDQCSLMTVNPSSDQIHNA